MQGYLMDVEHPMFWGTLGNVGLLAVHGVGITFMLTKWPESRWPGRFDYWFQSHQIWHVCVTLGAVLQYAGHRSVRQHMLYIVV